jgi:hypothetical protein
MILLVTRTRLLASAVCLAPLLAAPARSHAQTYLPPVMPYDCASDDCCGLCGKHQVFRRTYSYYYAPWYNQPRHFPVVGPDGCKHWTKTVRGLPLGTPWWGVGP